MNKALILIEESGDFVVLDDQHGVLEQEVDIMDYHMLEDYGVDDHRPGYYWCLYTTSIEHEHLDGYPIASYSVVDTVDLVPASYISVLWLNSITLTKDLSWAFKRLFKKQWTYQADYGGSGLSHTTWIWKAYWYKWTKKDLGWGKPFQTWVE